MAASGVVGPTSGAVIKATTAFFDAFLKHEPGALRAVSADGRTSLSAVHTAWTRDPGHLVLPRSWHAVHLMPRSPQPGLHNGQAVTVRWSGYTAGKVVNILECSHVDIATASSAGCSFAHAAILHPDPTGSGSAVLHVGTGTVGNGVCDAGDSCYVVVNNASSTDPSDTKELRIGFSS